jgi:hypothetical protein
VNTSGLRRPRLAARGRAACAALRETNESCTATRRDGPLDLVLDFSCCHIVLATGCPSLDRCSSRFEARRPEFDYPYQFITDACTTRPYWIRPEESRSSSAGVSWLRANSDSSEVTWIFNLNTGVNHFPFPVSASLSSFYSTDQLDMTIPTCLNNTPPYPLLRSSVSTRLTLTLPPLPASPCLPSLLRPLPHSPTRSLPHPSPLTTSPLPHSSPPAQSLPHTVSHTHPCRRLRRRWTKTTGEQVSVVSVVRGGVVACGVERGCVGE